MAQLRPRPRRYIVNDAYKDIVEQGLQQVLDKMDLMLSVMPKNRTGGRHIVQNTLNQYEMHYRGMEVFCSMIGDFDSLLMLQLNAPEEYRSK